MAAQIQTVRRDYRRRSDLRVPSHLAQRVGEFVACCVLLGVSAALFVLLAVRAGVMQ